MKLERILVAGAGGQGSVLLGKLLANAAIDTVPRITFFPSYGAEVRGGTSHCQVILSDDEISSPVAQEFDTMVVMNPESADTFLPRLTPKGLAVINSSLCKTRPGPGRILIPATQEADRLGDPRVANLVMLGALLSRRPVVRPARIESLLRDLMAAKPSILQRNLAAFHCGMALTC